MADASQLVTRRTKLAWAASALALVLALVLVISREPFGDRSTLLTVPPRQSQPPVPNAVAASPAAERPKHPAVALAPAGAGNELLWSTAGTGDVFRAQIKKGKVGKGQLIARLDVVKTAQAGVRGLVFDRGRVFAAYVRRTDRRLVVAEIGQQRPRLIWAGTHAGRSRVGGGLLARKSGQIVVAVGDQGRYDVRGYRYRGRLVSLDPNGANERRPRRLSAKWHDPKALASSIHGRIWVADRAGAGNVERFGRGDLARGTRVNSQYRRAPVALVSGSDGSSLLVCGYLSGFVEQIEVLDGNRIGATSPTKIPCRYGLTAVGKNLVAVDDGGLPRVAATPSALGPTGAPTKPN